MLAQCYSLLHHWNEPGMPATDYCDTSLEGGAMAELDRVLDRGVGIIAATAFNAGILVSGAKSDGPPPMCNYRPATQMEKDRTNAMERVCQAHGVELPAAALQFSTAHPAVASLITGFSSAQEAKQCFSWQSCDIPTQMWDDLKSERLIHPDAATPKDGVDVHGLQ